MTEANEFPSAQDPGNSQGRRRISGHLEVSNLQVRIRTGEGAQPILDGVSFALPRNKTLGLFGPSGSGKTTVALSILGLPPGGRQNIVDGSVRVNGCELTSISDTDYGVLRGSFFGMVFQDPSATLIPTLRIGRQLRDSILAHNRPTARENDEKVIDLLSEVGFQDPDKVIRAFPHELSGGMKQRVAIALALASDPSILVADEPTASLDAKSTDEILKLIAEVRERRELSVLLISHDLSVIDRLADDTVEIRRGSTRVRPHRSSFAERSSLPSTGLLDPTGSNRVSAKHGEVVLEMKNVSAAYPGMETGKQAITDISLSISRGETLALIGETGAGKTTVARAALRLIEPSCGQVLLEQIDITHLDARRLLRHRRHISYVSQHPASSLNPKQSINRIVTAPLIAQGVRNRDERSRRAREALDAVELSTKLSSRRPHELSGGQQQRVALARAIVTRPQVLICDEPFTSVDPSLREQLTERLMQLQSDLGASFLIIAHDLELVTEIANNVIVIHHGRIDGTESAPRNPQRCWR